MNNKLQKWQEISSEQVFQKYSTKIEKIIYKLPDGKESDFYIQKAGDVVCVMALTRDNMVIMAKQYRPGPNEILSELPGGSVDAGEDPTKAIERELREETGYKGTVQFVTICFDDAYSTRKRYCFVATECEKVAEPKTGETEFVELELMSLNDFRNLLRTGKMTDVEVGYLGLDFLKLLH
jgi:ADP-ribose pyrophosphatase